MRLKLLFFSFVAVLTTIVACNTEEPFICTLVDSEIEEIGPTHVLLNATINTSDFSAVEQVGFMIARQGSEKYEWMPAKRGRVFELRLEELKPSTAYEYRVFVRANGESWIFKRKKFKTLADGQTPETPDTPEEPENPETPDEPEDPETPEEPENPETPDEPEDPENPDEPETPNPPAQGNTYRMGWYELPIERDDDHNGIDDKNSTYYYAHHLCAGGEKNAQRTGTARNFSVCFSSTHHCPVWVAAPRHKSYESGASRTDAYGQDPQIPSNIQYNSKSTGGGCNKGHMLGSAERLSTSATNRQVFYYTNIAPQYSSTFNTGGGAWNNLEDHIDKLVCADTLYEVVGCYFDTYTDKYGNTGRPAKIEFGGRSDVSRPTMFYYALLRTKKGNGGKSVKECSASELQCAAFVICHEQAKGHKPESRDLISIEELERLTGFTYFENVPNAPKSTLNTSDWL